MTIAENLRRVRDRVANAAVRAGRAPEEVTLVGVTKYVTAAEAAELVQAGCRDLGESRPQELWNKAADPVLCAGQVGAAGPVRWHLVGHLQRNKVRRTLPLVTMIHSVDSQRLLGAIDENADDTRAPVRVLLEVNTSGERAKHGLAPAELEPLLAAAEDYQRVQICGLMTMAALEGGPAVAARNFAALRQLRDSLQQQSPGGWQLDELSMGMSGDFEEAIQAGATLIRVGSLLWE